MLSRSQKKRQARGLIKKGKPPMQMQMQGDGRCMGSGSGQVQIKSAEDRGSQLRMPSVHFTQ
jgi:hypothetical protein